jgi:hypothetical protein
MAIPLVQVQHKTTGAKTFLAETALPSFPDYVETSSQKAREQEPDGTAFPTAVADEVEADEDEQQSPAKNASTEEWRSYAITQGMADDEAASMSRDDLVAHYSTEES